MELHKINVDKKIMQHNAITSGRFDFTACQLDILFMLLASLGKDDAPGKVYSLYAKDIEAITGRKWNYQQLQHATEEMGSRMFVIETEKSLKQLWLFSMVEYQKGKGYFDVSLSDKARPYLFELKNNFTVFQLKSALSCTSKYAKRLYALACQWRNTDPVKILSIDELKEMLYLKDPTGKQKEQFTEITAFKTKVLDIAKKQINEETDIQFDYELVKRGRSFEFIKIFVGVQKISQVQINLNEPIDYQKHVRNVMAYGVSESAAKQIAVRHYAEFEAMVTDLKKAISEGRKVEDPAAYLVAVFQKKGVLK